MPSDVLSEARRLLRMMTTDRQAALARLRRVVGIARAHVLFHGAELGERVNATGYVRVRAEGRMVLADHVQFAGGMIPSEIVCRRGGELVFGDYTMANYGIVFDCAHSIHVGRRCLFGSMTRVRDHDGARSGPIVIEDDVWLAHGVVVEPGVRIGRGSVVSAGSVVTRDVPPESLVVGDPGECFRLGREVENAVWTGASAGNDVDVGGFREAPSRSA